MSLPFKAPAPSIPLTLGADAASQISAHWTVVYKAAGLVAAVQFYVALEGSLLLPLGPTLCKALGFAPQHLGYLNSAFLVAAAMAGLIGSLYLDRFERRAALATALGGLAICTALAGLATSLTTLMACRFLAGLCGGPAAALGLAVIGDTAPPEARARAIGAVAAGSGLAVILGVPFALTLSEVIGWRAMLLVIGAVGVVLAGGAYLLLPRGLGHRGGTSLRHALAEFAVLLRRRETPLVLATSALIFSSTLMLAANLAPYFVFNLGVPQTQLKFLWMAGGVFGLMGSQGSSALAHRYGASKVLWGLSGLAIVVFFMLFVQKPLVVPVAILFCGFMICANGRIVIANTISSLASSSESRGRFMSLVSATNQTATAAALIIASVVLQTASSGALVNVPCLGLFGMAAAMLSPCLAAALAHRAART